MVHVDVEAFKKEGFSFEEIEKVKKSVSDFGKTRITHSHDEVKLTTRKKLFSKTAVNNV